MPRLVPAPEACRDRREIRDHIPEDDPKAARRVVSRLRGGARKLTRGPGRLRQELGPHVRSFAADRCLLRQRPFRRAAGIELGRAFHGVRAIAAAFCGDRD